MCRPRVGGLRGARQPALASVYAWQLGNRQRFIEWVNPRAARWRTLDADARSGAAYVARHRATMRGWAYLGNAPHMDLMALATASGHFELYFLARIFGFSALALVLSCCERRACVGSALDVKATRS